MKLPREITLAEIAMVAGGKLKGSPLTKVSSVSTSPFTAGNGDLVLVFDEKTISRISEIKATAVIVPEGVESDHPKVIVKRPMLALQKMLSAVQPTRFFFWGKREIHPSAVVHESAEIGKNVAIGANAVVGPETKIGSGTIISPGCVIGGKVKIGEKCLLHPGVIIGDYVQIGNNVIFQQGASAGSDGFGYVTERESNLERRIRRNFDLEKKSNPHLKIPQIGTVIIEDDVEVGANTTIDRATMGTTIIGRGTKIDNLVMIAHNCKIGEEAILVSQVGIAGSCTIGDRAVLAGQAGLKDHIKVGEDAIVEAKAGVMNHIPADEAWVGSPAEPHLDHMKNLMVFKKGPALMKEIRQLKKRLEELEKALAEREPVMQGKEN